MRTNRLLIALSAVVLIAGACASSPTATSAPSTSAASSSGTSPASAAPSSAPGSVPASAATSGAPSSSAATSAGPSATAGACAPEPPTAASTGWTTLQAHDGDFNLMFPGTWDKIYGAFVFTTASLLDAQTFAETGLPATSETRADLVRAPGVGLPNASILIVPGVTSDTATVFARQVDRFKAIPDIKVVASNLVACVGGDQALGIAFTFNKDTTYQESWYIVRNGRSYDFQWLAPKGQEQSDTFREMFRTLKWNPDVPVATPQPTTSTAPTTAPTTAPSSSAGPSASTAASAFVLAGMATKVDTSATAANPKDFVSVIPKDSKAIYSVFVLRPGLTGQVNGALRQGDKVLVTLSLQYGPKNTWGDFRINSANGIAPGAYTMVMTFVPTGETVNLPFTVK